MAMHGRILNSQHDLEAMTWQDLAFVQTMVSDDPNAPVTNLLLQRLVISGETELREVMRQNGLAQAAFAALEECRHAMPDGLAGWQAVLQYEYARHHPHEFNLSWIESDTKQPRWLLVGWITWALEARPDLHHAILTFLKGRPHLINNATEGFILAPLVRSLTLPPSETMGPFISQVGDDCLVAAAQWHHERQQHDSVIEIHRQVRPLSRHWDIATCFAIAAYLCLQQIEKATRLCEQLVEACSLVSIVLQWQQWSEQPPTKPVIKRVLITCPENETSAWQACLALAIRSIPAQELRSFLHELRPQLPDSPERNTTIDYVLSRLGNPTTINNPGNGHVDL